MNPIALAGPAVEPVTLAEMKAFLRLDGDDENDLVTSLTAAARLCVERATRLCLVQQTWRVRLQCRPPDGVVHVALAPVLAISAVRILDVVGASVAVAPSAYDLHADCDPVRIRLNETISVPAGGAVEIDLSCGFGPTAADVPEPLRLAVRQLAARLFEHRGDDPAGDQGGWPTALRAVIAPFCRPRLA